VGSLAPNTIGDPANIDVDGRDMPDVGFQFFHDTHQSEDVVPNDTTGGFARGNDGDRTHVLPNDTAVEDFEFLEAMLHRHTERPQTMIQQLMHHSLLS